LLEHHNNYVGQMLMTKLQEVSSNQFDRPV